MPSSCLLRLYSAIVDCNFGDCVALILHSPVFCLRGRYQCKSNSAYICDCAINIMPTMQSVKREHPAPPCESCGKSAPAFKLSVTCYDCLWHRCFNCAYYDTAQSDCCQRVYCLEHITICAVCKKYICDICSADKLFKCCDNEKLCGKTLCVRHSVTCDNCENTMCSPCGTVCKSCLGIFCPSCYTQESKDKHSGECTTRAPLFGPP